MDGLVKAKADKNVAMVIGLSKYIEKALCCVLNAGLGYLFELWIEISAHAWIIRENIKLRCHRSRYLPIFLKKGMVGEWRRRKDPQEPRMIDSTLFCVMVSFTDFIELQFCSVLNVSIDQAANS